MLLATNSDYVLFPSVLLSEVDVSGTGEFTIGSAEVFSARNYYSNLHNMYSRESQE